MSLMKIGIVCYPTLGGSGIVATELGRELALRGHEVHFIAYEHPFRLRIDLPNIHFHPVEINYYDLFRYPDYALTLAVKIAEVAKLWSLDILHVHYAIPHATSAYLAKQILGTSSPAVVTTLHGTDITLIGSEPSYLEIVKFSIQQSQGVTAVSHSLKEQTLSTLGITQEIEVIHNFFSTNPQFFGKKPFKECLAPNGEKILLHSSNFRPVKRVEDLIPIFREVRKFVPVKLVLLGTGVELGRLREMVCKYSLEKEVHFIGKSLNIDPYVASADLFILPSAQESFGLSALEAMAYGVPVVASDVGGLGEVVLTGETGYLDPVGDTEAMAKHVVQLLTDQEMYQKMSEAGMKRAAEKFCPEKIIPQYEACYRHNLNDKK